MSERDLHITSWYVENESGSTLIRLELFRLLRDAYPSDVLFVEQVVPSLLALFAIAEVSDRFWASDLSDDRTPRQRLIDCGAQVSSS